MEQPRKSTEKRNFIDKFAHTLDQHIRGVQYGLYGLGLTGLFIAFRSVRPFQKFYRPGSIPRSFIEKQVPLRGLVSSAELGSGSSALLQVAHEPVVSLGRSGKPPHLPVTLAGISPTQLGLSWLQVTLEHQPVTFTVLATNSNAAVARVSYQGKDVSTRLVELGFARLVPYDNSLERYDSYKRLYSALLRGERHAERHGNGMWHGSAPFYWRLADRITSQLRLLLQRFRPRIKLPLLGVR